MTEQVIRATGGAAGRTARQLEDMAQALAGTTLASADEVRQAQQQLMTFRSIANETFDDVIRLSQDLATVGFGSLSSNAVSLGRALEDPRRGLDQLRRSGISFTQQQRDMINSLIDSGNELEAQRMILNAVDQQVGGAGAAAGGGLSGAYAALTNEIGNFNEEAGRQVSELLRLESVMRGITAMMRDDMSRVSPGLRLLGVTRSMGEIEADIAQRAESLERLRQAEANAFGGTGGGMMRQQIEALEAAQRADQELVARERLRQGMEELTAARRAEEAQIERQNEATRTAELLQRTSTIAAREQVSVAAQTIARLQDEIELFGRSELARRTYYETTAQGINLYSEEGQRIADLVEQLHRMEEAQQANAQIAQEFGSAMANAFSGLVSGSHSAEQALEQLKRSLTQLLINQAFQAILGSMGGGGMGGGNFIASMFAGGFANGAAFAGGNVIPFARGGVVSSPTMFPMSGGRSGLMGEAGPEAIMPLSRGSDGKLGVMAQGGGMALHITVGLSRTADGDLRPFVEDIATMRAGSVVAAATPRIVERSTTAAGGALARGDYDRGMSNYGVKRAAKVR